MNNKIAIAGNPMSEGFFFFFKAIQVTLSVSAVWLVFSANSNRGETLGKSEQIELLESDVNYCCKS